MAEHIEITTETKTLYDVTVRQLAEAFMGLDSNQQAEFFTQCAAIESTWKMPGMQWYDVKRVLAKRRQTDDYPTGWDFVMDLAAPFYAHWEPTEIYRRVYDARAKAVQEKQDED